MTSITGKDNYLDEVLFYLPIVTKVPISFCFLTVGKSNIAELWKGGRLEEQNKMLFLNWVGV